MFPWWRGAGFVSCPVSHLAAPQGGQFSFGLALPLGETLWRLWTQTEMLRGPAAAGQLDGDALIVGTAMAQGRGAWLLW